MKREMLFNTEAELVEAFVDHIAGYAKQRPDRAWTAYPESCGFDLVLHQPSTDIQVGIEAKLTLNAKVLCQILPGDSYSYSDRPGPDYRAVLVGSCQAGLGTIAAHLGITVLHIENRPGWSYRKQKQEWHVTPHLPDEAHYFSVGGWCNWLPARKLSLPEYVPDVAAGKPSPVALTDWKIRAIKLMIILDRDGFITRRHIAALKMSATIWTARFGHLARGEKGYVRYERTPDLRAQHPVNYAQIEADFDRWYPEIEKEIAK